LEKIVGQGRSTPGPDQKNDVPVKWRQFLMVPTADSK
jgi:hypothetical protein